MSIECLKTEKLGKYTADGLAGDDLAAVDAHSFACYSCRARILESTRVRHAVRMLASKSRWNPNVDLNCLEDEQAAAYVEGRLDPVDREMLESHLDLCSTCTEDIRS